MISKLPKRSKIMDNKLSLNELKQTYSFKLDLLLFIIMMLSKSRIDSSLVRKYTIKLYTILNNLC